MENSSAERSNSGNLKRSNSERNRWLYTYRDKELSLEEILQAGSALYGNPYAISLYGRSPVEYFPLGVRLLGRTVVECCIDQRAEFLAEEAHRVTQSLFPGERPIVVDLFAGSGNLLFHLARRLNATTALGFEKDDAVFALTRRNLGLLHAPVKLCHGDYAGHLSNVRYHHGGPVVFIVSPPWGSGFDYNIGLDLCRTEPPVNHVVDLIRELFLDRSHVVMIQTHHQTLAASIRRVCAGFHRVFDSFASAADAAIRVGFLSCAHGVHNTGTNSDASGSSYEPA
jgi:16S rRNA G966 N2-methylase RsmD